MSTTTTGFGAGLVFALGFVVVLGFGFVVVLGLVVAFAFGLGAVLGLVVGFFATGFLFTVDLGI